jgi:polygalacturonase
MASLLLLLLLLALHAGTAEGWKPAAASEHICDYAQVAAQRGVTIGSDDTAILRALLGGECYAQAKAAGKERGVVLLPGYFPCDAHSCPVSDDGSAGLYISGALNLTSHTTLRVEWPAWLLATSNVSMYHWPLVGYKEPLTGEWNCGHMPHETDCRCGSTTCGFNMAPFVSSVSGSTDIAVDGGGTIDGNGDFFYPLRSKPHWPAEWREGPLEQRQKTIDPRLWEPFNSTGVTLFVSSFGPRTLLPPSCGHVVPSRSVSAAACVGVLVAASSSSRRSRSSLQLCWRSRCRL